jgi:predicted metal-dependent HD superfamily phosphohydrolase
MPPEPGHFQPAWVQLLESYRVAAADAMPVFNVLLAAYSSPDRHYHTLEHLDEMFRVAGRLAGITDDLRAVHLAIWFHDAVYDTRAKDNEHRSANLAVTLLGPIGVPRSELERVVNLVHATAHFAGDAPFDRETNILLDADLAILGASSDRYARYAADIRREYAWVPEGEYRAARAVVLQLFLSRPRLFRTDLMHEECDAQARANLQSELSALR